MSVEIEREIVEIRERLARLEEKVDWLIRLCKHRNNRDWILKWLYAAWLSFLSLLLGIEVYGAP